MSHRNGELADRARADGDLGAFSDGEALLDRAVGPDDVLGATGQIAPALEIVDTRWAGGAPSLSLLVADNVSAGRVVLGRRMPADHLRDAIEAKVDVGGKQITGDAGNVLVVCFSFDL